MSLTPLKSVEVLSAVPHRLQGERPTKRSRAGGSHRRDSRRPSPLGLYSITADTSYEQEPTQRAVGPERRRLTRRRPSPRALKVKRSSLAWEATAEYNQTLVDVKRMLDFNRKYIDMMNREFNEILDDMCNELRSMKEDSDGLLGETRMAAEQI
ncbi:hypothetical protein L227DRAFT_581140 [Lentinus tigrinus ALCF2SS1-6]|uniref:Uncharacterized protein n=2 Tax=Lentinus tigrinus TaxID=5365 RepID=A0A5C2RRB6_9APHY|nr:hypothetical protein L227DRAFT_581140 [Lentinus tigrinus ALCF2SS1-6]